MSLSSQPGVASEGDRPFKTMLQGENIVKVRSKAPAKRERMMKMQFPANANLSECYQIGCTQQQR